MVKHGLRLYGSENLRGEEPESMFVETMCADTQHALGTASSVTNLVNKHTFTMERPRGVSYG